MTLDLPPSTQGPAPDLVSHKLWREADVFGGGTFAGVSHAITAAPGQECLKFGAASGIGFATTYFCEVSRATTPAIVKEVVTASMTLTTVWDLLPQLHTVTDAWTRTWQSDKNLQTDKKEVGHTIGQFIVDNALSTGGGIFGAKLGANKMFHKVIDAPGVKNIARPALSGLERLEQRVLVAASNVKAATTMRAPSPVAIQAASESDLALMKVKIMAEAQESISLRPCGRD